MNKPAEALQSYLDPEYWGGHSLGYGPTEAMEYVPLFEPAYRSSRGTLRDRIATMEDFAPIEIYEDGEVFEAAKCAPGTLVILRQEILSGRANGSMADSEEFLTRPLPSRPLDVSPSLGPENTSIAIEAGKTKYYSMTRWGVVAVNKAGETVLHTTSTGGVQKLDNGEVIVPKFTPVTCKSPVKIGETQHYKGRRIERLTRINVLHVLAPATVLSSTTSQLPPASSFGAYTAK